MNELCIIGSLDTQIHGCLLESKTVIISTMVTMVHNTTYTAACTALTSSATMKQFYKMLLSKT